MQKACLCFHLKVLQLLKPVSNTQNDLCSYLRHALPIKNWSISCPYDHHTVVLCTSSIWNYIFSHFCLQKRHFSCPAVRFLLSGSIFWAGCVEPSDFKMSKIFFHSVAGKFFTSKRLCIQGFIKTKWLVLNVMYQKRNSKRNCLKLVVKNLWYTKY